MVKDLVYNICYNQSGKIGDCNICAKLIINIYFKDR